MKTSIRRSIVAALVASAAAAAIARAQQGTLTAQQRTQRIETEQ